MAVLPGLNTEDQEENKKTNTHSSLSISLRDTLAFLKQPLPKDQVLI